MRHKYQVVQIQTKDHQVINEGFGVQAAYTLEKWDNVLIVEIDENFNVNMHANNIRKAFGVGNNRPVIFTQRAIEFFTVERVEEPFWTRVWSTIKGWFVR